MKLKIFVLGHKDFDNERLKDPCLVKLFNYQCHNSLDNLCDNFYYETYMEYEVYEKLDKYLDDDTEYIGFCHYRRYFDILGKDIINIFENQNKDIILSTPDIWKENVIEQYNSSHDNTGEDWELIKYIIRNNYPEYINTLENVLNTHTISICNCFITKVDIFKQYMKFVFDIIKKYREYHNFNTYQDVYKYVLENKHRFPRLDLSSTNRMASIEYNAKLGGFMIERLLNVFFLHNFDLNRIQFVNL